MRWEDERYVRLYTRDTADWMALSWDAQALMMQLIRKVDRAGALPLGRHGKRAVAIVLGQTAAWERIAPALEELLADGCVRISGDCLFLPNFLAAQEAVSSDAQRKRDQREREQARLLAAALPVTFRDEMSRDVTGGHAESRAVTPSLAVPSVPSEVVPQNSDVAPTDPIRAMSSASLPGVVAGAEPDRRGAPPDPDNVFRLQEQRANAPPKRRSRQQIFAQYFWDSREEHLAELGLPPSEETGWSAQLQNARLGFVKKHSEELLAFAVRAYLDNDKMRDKDPPWPLHFFVSDFSKYESMARKQVAS